MELGPGRSARHSPAEPARAVQPPNGPSGSEPPSQGCAIDATHLLPQRAVRTSKSGPGPGAGTYTATRDYHDFAGTRAGPHSLCIPPNPHIHSGGPLGAWGDIPPACLPTPPQNASPPGGRGNTRGGGHLRPDPAGRLRPGARRQREDPGYHRVPAPTDHRKPRLISPPLGRRAEHPQRARRQLGPPDHSQSPNASHSSDGSGHRLQAPQGRRTD